MPLSKVEIQAETAQLQTSEHGCPLLEVILHSGRSFWGERLVRCPEYREVGGSKCTIYMAESIKGHGICLLYGGCPLFGDSVIRGFTVLCIHKLIIHALTFTWCVFHAVVFQSSSEMKQ